jgi:hypothetical protein
VWSSHRERVRRSAGDCLLWSRNCGRGKGRGGEMKQREGEARDLPMQTSSMGWSSWFSWKENEKRLESRVVSAEANSSCDASLSPCASWMSDKSLSVSVVTEAASLSSASTASCCCNSSRLVASLSSTAESAVTKSESTSLPRKGGGNERGGRGRDKPNAGDDHSDIDDIARRIGDGHGVVSLLGDGEVDLLLRVRRVGCGPTIAQPGRT